MRSSEFSKTAAWVLLVLIVAAALLALGINGFDAVATEQGTVEVLSAIALLACIAFFWGPRLADPGARAGAVLLVLLLARELDLDKLPLQHGILSLKLYSGTAPLLHKLLGVACVLTVLFTFFSVLRRGAAPLLRGVMMRRGWAWLILAAMALVAMAKTLDGAGRKLGGIGLEASASVTRMAQFFEETGELASALCLMLGVARLPIRARISKAWKPNGRTHSDRSLRDNLMDGARSKG